MTWRSSSTTKDRIFSSLTYIIPILEVLGLGSFLFNLIPPLALLFIPFVPLAGIYFYNYGGLSIVQFAVFIGLFAGVVRNYKLGHLLRYNAMQALMLSIVAFLCQAVLGLLREMQVFALAGSSGMLLSSTLASTIFLVVVSASVYSVIQALRGLYAEIPIISEVAHSQVR
ncbi:Tic20 family protein [Iningainema tapete]|uniref:Tic20 family protein Ycf60 n=1 Tax=Iningainema tapete BLCC-T55 TaxID=2748662 RepID=A0A8J6XGC6_9CYAN|nr:Tic20 family protein [Iningainema tapete]MBD2776315.1 hypothetical protein [Iningainema tapete BLCC-T55]